MAARYMLWMSTLATTLGAASDISTPVAVVPRVDICVPLTNSVDEAVAPFQRYRLVDITETGFVVLCSNKIDRTTLGYIPSTDRLGNRTAKAELGLVEILPMRHAQMGSGHVMLHRGREYEVISQDASHYHVRYVFDDFCTSVAIEKRLCSLRSPEEREQLGQEVHRDVQAAARETTAAFDALVERYKERAKELARYEESQRERGLVKVNGQWYTPDDAKRVTAILQQRQADKERREAEQLAAMRQAALLKQIALDDERKAAEQAERRKRASTPPSERVVVNLVSRSRAGAVFDRILRIDYGPYRVASGEERLVPGGTGYFMVRVTGIQLIWPDRGRGRVAKYDLLEKGDMLSRYGMQEPAAFESPHVLVSREGGSGVLVGSDGPIEDIRVREFCFFMTDSGQWECTVDAP